MKLSYLIKYTLLLLWMFNACAHTTEKQLNHVAIIADGNRRWAQENNLDSFEGHKKGFIYTAPSVITDLWDMNIHTVTIWGFSTENWNRDPQEIAHLMDYFDQLLMNMLPVAKKYNAKIIHLGRKDRLPEFLLKTIMWVESKTAGNASHIFNIALDWGGKDEMVRAFQRMYEMKSFLGVITEDDIVRVLDTAHQPYSNPDLIIRTSGELRLSGFMMWQAAYSEFYFIQKHFPALDRNDLEEAVASFTNRQRRFGK
jgi:undecaprenyl diphosphate synthase